MSNRKYLTDTKEWRYYFDSKTLQSAENMIKRGNFRDFRYNDDTAAAVIGSGFTPLIRHAPTCYSDEWEEECFSCTCAAANPKKNWWGGITSYGRPCAHEACLLMLWEKARGPWTFTETDEEWEERKAAEEHEAKMKKYEAKKNAEEKEIRPASEWHLKESDLTETPFFNLPEFLQNRKTTLFALNTAAGHLDVGEIRMTSEPKLGFGSDGRQIIEFSFVTDNEYEDASTSITFDGKEIIHEKCSCKKIRYGHALYGRDDSDVKLCGHELAAISLAWDYVLKHNPGDATDKKAEKLLSILDGGNLIDVNEDDEHEEDKVKCVSIVPRLLINEDGLSLTFKISKDGGRSLILKSFRSFQEAIEAGTRFEAGKNLNIDFSTETTDDDSEVWMDYIRGRINDADRVNNRLASNRHYYGRGVSVQSNETLQGASLDQFYRLAEGLDVEYENKTDLDKGTVHVGDAVVRIRLTGNLVSGSQTSPAGIRVTGMVPRVIEGQSGSYVLTDKSLGILSSAQSATITPFKSIADRHGFIDFTVGKNRLSEFYYRIVPEFLDNPFIDFTDETHGQLDELLPPEPYFTFRLDMSSSGRAMLKCEVTYEENTYSLGDGTLDADSGAYRDDAQEERVLKCIRRYFHVWDGKQCTWTAENDDDVTFTIMTEGLEAFSGFGEVTCTDRFMGRSVRSMPSVGVNISVDSGLLDISVLSRDVSRDELAEIYNSYSLKKKYHRLKDGSFLAIGDGAFFKSLEDLANGMDLTAEQLINEHQRLPLYRSLYLDHLLEEHDELVGSRDRTYRALIKGFRTIRDADYDVPGSMENVLRPYQTYGHKWLRTVTESGFGGILADEMGLGKTLEAISVISAMKDSGSLNEPALIVCPASLIYNWEEEIRRFAPELIPLPVTGTAAVRKKMLAASAGKEAVRTKKGKADEIPKPADVLITSYDLLRQDVENYRKRKYSIMIIDEAQYIKNSKAAMTKAVKVLDASRRIALTGTPIENRLAELWSIFDFLMPGFLHDYAKFQDQYEIPITKKKDPEVTEKLKQMVRPFILRRLKNDVLKDLPPKLEEVRYARLENRQRELYDAQVLKMKGMLKDSSGKGEDKIRILAELTRIRQICCDPSLLFENYDGDSSKRFACLELIKNAMASDHRMLVFSQFTSMLELLEEDLKKEGIPYYKITGATSKEQRVRYVHEFNEGDVPVFLVSLRAGGTGLNLTGADVVIHYDPWWNLAVQNQATDRAHRIGQEKTVTVYKLIAKDTIEERILQLQETKKDLADAILSGESSSLMSLSEEELLGLLV